MDYRVFLKKSAEKELQSLPDRIHDKVVDALVSLKENPRPLGVKKLKAREGYRIRLGNYRILYLVDDRERKIEIFSIAHRKEIYR
jgi:mRNA interferase RelE/StbE